ncbi:response regulator transcription factor [Nocardiopsis ansamitocini]|uniref:DNA-binding response regulator n=1 Tax=Nocardiopsis ansamitocini TaxID=1670832 RepID=A0A9W6UIP8_9ACTN|nr:response regulator transcription factor [Nocardiopsis ansamitocini]GLU50146.1 DNA-binding response regulator [Nocardiopsis ansamitocini]
MCAHVLVAEDDTMQAEVIRRYLEHDGHAVLVVHDGHAAIAAARRHRPDLMVLDVMMPGTDGLEVCRILRAESDVAVLMLTARSTQDDLLAGLDLGADDYMTKPYNPRELMARVRTLLRRVRRTQRPEDRTLRVGAVTVDPVRHLVEVAGSRVGCTPVEFQLLEALCAEPGRVFTRAQLLERVHGAALYITERSVDAHIKNLRRKIEPVPRRPVRLLTVYGVGYKLVDPESGHA